MRLIVLILPPKPLQTIWWRAYYHTYGLPVLTTHCSNNYGPYQYSEKFIPRMIINALQGESLPVYGDGLNIRDWLYVKDHCAALRIILEKGQIGETYNIGGNNEKSNIEVAYSICDILDQLKPLLNHQSYKNKIKFVTDRPGHDKRYAINAAKIQHELNWKPQENFASGLAKTIQGYL